MGHHVESWDIMVIINTQLEEAGEEYVGRDEGGYAEYDEAAFLCRREEGSSGGLPLFVGLYIESDAEEIED